VHNLIIFALVGLAAQLVDGTLGMAYGVTSTTLLLTAGYTPAVASASVHLAEIGTTLASGLAHWRFGNVDWVVVRRIALPGAVGAFCGATVLSTLSTEAARPWTAAILLALGCYVLVRFTAGLPGRRLTGTPGRRFLAPLGAFAGFIDATGGGGWGPVATPALLTTGRMEPRKVIGTVGTSEFVVALAASVGFLLSLGSAAIVWTAVGGLLIGGLVAAPVAAWLVRIVPARMLGPGVGGLIIITNSRTLLAEFDVPGGTRAMIYLLLSSVWVVALATALRGLLAERCRRSGPAEGLAARGTDRL
jgi:uncharacterized protein